MGGMTCCIPAFQGCNHQQVPENVTMADGPHTSQFRKQQFELQLKRSTSGGAAENLKDSFQFHMHIVVQVYCGTQCKYCIWLLSHKGQVKESTPAVVWPS